MRAFTSPVQSSSPNSGHSVTSTAASAPSSASSADSQMRAPPSIPSALAAATGSYTRTLAPSPWSRPASTRLVASRMSSVSGLKATPSSAISLPTSEPRCFWSLPIVRRFWSSLTSITEVSSWKW